MNDKFQFSDAQALTASAAADYYWNLGEAVKNKDIVGWLNVRITVALATITSLRVSLISSADTTIGAPLTDDELVGADILAARIPIGTIISLGVCDTVTKQYLGVYYTFGGSGTVSVDSWWSDQPAATKLNKQVMEM